MLRLDKVIKPWKESAALNDHIKLYGFWNETAFLTRSGDLGMVLQVQGVDYESLDTAGQEYAVKRLESALKAFGQGFHVYQYLFKANHPEIPFARYNDPIVEAAVEQRRRFFESKRDHLYQIEIFYVVLLEGARSKRGIGTAIARLFSDPSGAIEELQAQFSNSRVTNPIVCAASLELASSVTVSMLIALIVYGAIVRWWHFRCQNASASPSTVSLARPTTAVLLVFGNQSSLSC